MGWGSGLDEDGCGRRYLVSGGSESESAGRMAFWGMALLVCLLGGCFGIPSRSRLPMVTRDSWNVFLFFA